MNILKMNAGILTEKIIETKTFYTQILGFKIKFENEFYLLLDSPSGKESISFLTPNHPTQHPFFHPKYQGQGMYLTIAVDNVDEFYKELTERHVEVKFEIRNEAWGERHFAIEDPNGIGIDIVEYIK